MSKHSRYNIREIGHSVITFALRGKVGVEQNADACEQRARGMGYVNGNI